MSDIEVEYTWIFKSEVETVMNDGNVVLLAVPVQVTVLPDAQYYVVNAVKGTIIVVQYITYL